MAKKLPGKIIEGRKKSFFIPLAHWFREDLSALIGEYLSEDQVRKRGYFDPKFVNQLCDLHVSGRRDYSKELWALICFEIWHRQYLS